MKIYLNRYMQNRNFTHGKLQIEGFPDVFDTLEREIPCDKFSYVKHCLPPREYEIKPELSLIALKTGSVRKPWPSLSKVKWFQKASILTIFEDHSLLSGRIFIGLGSNDEWSVNQNDLVTAKIIAAMQTIYDPLTDTFTEPVTLIITENPDLIVHDYDYQHYLQEQQAKQEAKEQMEAEARLQQLLQNKSPLPTSPRGGE